MAIVTLTSPNCYWGSPEIALEAAHITNDDTAAQSRRYPDRIRFMCSLPWLHAKLAVSELRRACDELGAVGVMVLANIDERSLTNKQALNLLMIFCTRSRVTGSRADSSSWLSSASRNRPSESSRASAAGTFRPARVF